MPASQNLSQKRAQLSPELLAQLERRLRGDADGKGPNVGIPRRPEAGLAPLSFAQQRLWFLDQLSPGNPFYNISSSLRLQTRLEAELLERAINEIVRRHESLRTLFQTKDGQPKQQIEPELHVPLTRIELRTLAQADREVEAIRLADEEAKRPFDLARGPLIRTVLIELGEFDALFLLTLHHIVADGWSMAIFGRELAAFYQALAARQPSALAKLPIQYADYAVWQRDWLSGFELSRQLEYWRERLSNLPTLALPSDRPRPKTLTFRGASVKLELGVKTAAEIRALARLTRSTPYMVLLGAFAALLSRYTGQEDLPVGTPVSNRNRIELEDLIGNFVNTLILRLDASGDPTFLDLLDRVRRTVVDAQGHQELPFEKLVEELHPERDLTRNPLFQVSFQLFSGADARRNQPAPDANGLAGERGSAVYDLAFNLWETGENITGVIEFSTELFDLPTIERMASHFTILAAGAVLSPRLRVSQLPLLTLQERNRLLIEWNQTTADYPRTGTVQELIETQARQTPDAVAVEFDAGKFSYRELVEKAGRLGQQLRRLGIGQGQRVGLCVRRSGRLLVGLLGILKAGAAYVPLDPGDPKSRLEEILTDSQSAAVVTDQDCASAVRSGSRQLVHLDAQAEVEGAEEASGSIALEAPVGSGEDIAYVIYTSGSTGRPKGVQIQQRGLVNYLTWCVKAYDLAAGRGAPVHSSISFDLTITGLLAPLLAGRTVFLLGDNADPEALGQFLRRNRDCSLVKITPAHLRVLSLEIPASEAAGLTRRFIIGGENLTASDIAFWQRWAPETELINEYGPTETVVGCCTYRVPAGFSQTGSVPIGRPIANTRLYVLDCYLNPMPVGLPGELYIGGDGVAAGYLNRTEQTAQRFVPDPFGPAGGRLYRTGDWVRYLADGNLEFLGRIDDQVKIRGYRVELGEVEAALASHPQVRALAVIARADATGHQQLVGYVVPAGDSAAETLRSSLRSHLHERVPEYMCPSIFVVLDALPLSANGKVDRRALPNPDADRLRPEQPYEAPRNQLERDLAALWSEVLGVGNIGRQDRFFDLGGHSLMAVQVVSRIRERLGANVSLLQFFERPTVASLAEFVGTVLWAAERFNPATIEADGEVDVGVI